MNVDQNPDSPVADIQVSSFCWLTRRRNPGKTSPSVSFEWALINLAVVSDKSFCLRVALKAKADVPKLRSKMVVNLV